jgi:hypothetical protein
VPRDQWKRPLIWHEPGTCAECDAEPVLRTKGKRKGQPEFEGHGYTRASSFGEYLEDGRGIGKWKAANAVWAVVRNRALSLRTKAVATCTEQADKSALYSIVDDALEWADVRAAADLGTALHAVTEKLEAGQEIPHLGEDQPAVDAYMALMRESRAQVIATEIFVVCDEFGVAGTLDRAVTFPYDITPVDDQGEILGDPIPAGTPIVVDIKTSSTADYFGSKFTVQTWIYDNGRTYDPATHLRGRSFGNGRFALIIHVPSGGSMARFHWVDLQRGRKAVERAAEVREQRAVKRLIVPAAPFWPEDDEWSEDEIKEVEEVKRDAVIVETVNRMVDAHTAHAAQIAATVQGAHERRQAAERAVIENVERDGVVWDALLKCNTRDDARKVWRRYRASWRDEHREFAESLV